MRVNVYAEEMTDQIEIISKTIDGQVFTGFRIYLHLPVSYKTLPNGCDPRPVTATEDGQAYELKGPFMHRPGDDDSSAVTFWGKRDLRPVLEQALAALAVHYDRGKP